MNELHFAKFHEGSHDRRKGERREGNFFGEVDVNKANELHKALEAEAERDRQENPEKYQDVTAGMDQMNTGLSDQGIEVENGYMPLLESLEMVRQLNTEKISNIFVNRLLERISNSDKLPREYEAEYYTAVLYLRDQKGNYLKLPADVFHSTDAFVDFMDEGGDVVTVRIDGKMNNKDSQADVIVRYPNKRNESDEDILEIANRAAEDVLDVLLRVIEDNTRTAA